MLQWKKEVDCKWDLNENGLIVLIAHKRREVKGNSEKKYSHGP
jgi:hypothetical protein